MSGESDGSVVWTAFCEVPGLVANPGGEPGRLFENSQYQVVQREFTTGPLGAYVHLTIRNRDGGRQREWGDFQRIKNELVGPDCQAVEIYPPEHDVVDTGNYYHLWVFREYRLPIGLATGS